MKKLTLFAACLLLAACTTGCASLAGGGTGVDPKFLDGVKEILTDTHCGHHDEFRANVGAAGIPASTTIVAVRDCPTPAAAAAASVGVVSGSFDGSAPLPAPQAPPAGPTTVGRDH